MKPYKIVDNRISRKVKFEKLLKIDWYFFTLQYTRTNQNSKIEIRAHNIMIPGCFHFTQPLIERNYLSHRITNISKPNLININVITNIQILEINEELSIWHIKLNFVQHFSPMTPLWISCEPNLTSKHVRWSIIINAVGCCTRVWCSSKQLMQPSLSHFVWQWETVNSVPRASAYSNRSNCDRLRSKTKRMTNQYSHSTLRRF